MPWSLFAQGEAGDGDGDGGSQGRQAGDLGAENVPVERELRGQVRHRDGVGRLGRGRLGSDLREDQARAGRWIGQGRQ